MLLRDVSVHYNSVGALPRMHNGLSYSLLSSGDSLSIAWSSITEPFGDGSPTGSRRSSFSDDEESRPLYLSIPTRNTPTYLVFLLIRKASQFAGAALSGCRLQRQGVCCGTLITESLPSYHSHTLASSRHHVLKMGLLFYIFREVAIESRKFILLATNTYAPEVYIAPRSFSFQYVLSERS
ncbi:hypothetical protein K443DRAFT_400456 [Laccaria amethystina LaAM-08-1]|uniref:Uncharacterized protein n=1 Tax=Laccaria amethystina LaAM-08-1 TaxID=1095629 RepID=A0A0C9Y425_9AGAR|nr:hypothetical protein K443DRAFT_400456 [Laccaria amethystina LaAM-08-1]